MPRRVHWFDPAEAQAGGPRLPLASAVNAAAGACAELPEPWLVLRSSRAWDSVGPPWVNFIAFHPSKGIALVDVVPAEPDEAVGPLREFLIGSGLDFFAQDGPPIVALAITRQELPLLESKLDALFTDLEPPPPGADWVEITAEFLLSVPALMLRRIARWAEEDESAASLQMPAPVESGSGDPEPERQAAGDNPVALPAPRLVLAQPESPPLLPRSWQRIAGLGSALGLLLGMAGYWAVGSLSDAGADRSQAIDASVAAPAVAGAPKAAAALIPPAQTEKDRAEAQRDPVQAMPERPAPVATTATKAGAEAAQPAASGDPRKATAPVAKRRRRIREPRPSIAVLPPPPWERTPGTMRADSSRSR
jgi:hypothetical protein